MRTGLLALATVLLGAATAGAAVCTGTPSCLAAIEKAQQTTTSMTASFVQVKHLDLLEEPLESRGRMSFRRPDRMRLEIEEPMRSTILIDGHDIHIPGVSEKDRKAMSMAPVAAMFVQLGSIFSGATAELNKGFEVTAAPSGDDAIEVTLVPRLQSWREVFRRMQITFAGPDLMAKQVRLDDALGDRLEVTLENVRRNVDLPDSLFRPDPDAKP